MPTVASPGVKLPPLKQTGEGYNLECQTNTAQIGDMMSGFGGWESESDKIEIERNAWYVERKTTEITLLGRGMIWPEDAPGLWLMWVIRVMVRVWSLPSHSAYVDSSSWLRRVIKPCICRFFTMIGLDRNMWWHTDDRTGDTRSMQMRPSCQKCIVNIAPL